MPSGGYRRPTNPAPASGPGAKSRRTDGRQPTMRLSDAQYGEQATYREAQQGAPMAQAQTGGQTQSMPAQPVDTSGLIPLDAPTGQPDVPVTDGAALGPGAGPDALGAAEDEDQRMRYHSYIRVMKHMASRPEASASLRQLVRQMQGMARGG